MSRSPEEPKPETPESDLLRGIRVTGRELAHRINTPLGIALGNLELLGADPTLNPQQRAFVNEALLGLGQIETVVRNMSQIRRAVTYNSPVGESLDIPESMKDPTPKDTEPS